MPMAAAQDESSSFWRRGIPVSSVCAAHHRPGNQQPFASCFGNHLASELELHTNVPNPNTSTEDDGTANPRRNRHRQHQGTLLHTLERYCSRIGRIATGFLLQHCESQHPLQTPHALGHAAISNRATRVSQQTFYALRLLLTGTSSNQVLARDIALKGSSP
jgi:hypothetical protein